MTAARCRLRRWRQFRSSIWPCGGLEFMSSLDDSARAPVLPAPVPRRARLPLFEFFRTLRDNMIATYTEEAYERDIVQRKVFGRNRFLVNEPEAIKHVLLDNAANYQ